MLLRFSKIFKDFQKVAHGFMGCQFHREYSIFLFGQFLMHKKNKNKSAFLERENIGQCWNNIIPLHILFLYKLWDKVYTASYNLLSRLLTVIMQ